MKINSSDFVGLLREYVRTILIENSPEDFGLLRDALRDLGINVSRFLGQGLHGMAFLDENDDVVKVSMAKDEAEAETKVKRLQTLAKLSSAAFAGIIRAGVVGPMTFSGDRWVLSSGIAFFYVMEHVDPVPRVEARLAVKLLHELIDDPANVKKTVFVARRTMKRDGEDPEVVDRTLELFSKMQHDKVKHTDINADALMMRGDKSYCLVDLESAHVIET